MKLFMDCGSGVAGDMLLGAFVGLGLPIRPLQEALRDVSRRSDWRLRFRSVERAHWPAFALKVEGDRPFGSPAQMIRAIRRSHLPSAVKKTAETIIFRLQWAEAQAHGHADAGFDPNGLGLLDTVVDVVGNAWALWRLDVKEITASPLNTGRVAPATAALLKQAKVPVYPAQSEKELATPTGVAILTSIVHQFTTSAPVQIEASGYGAGTFDLPNRPNVLALHRLACPTSRWQSDCVVLLETVIDDMDPRLYPHVMELLLKAGALDVWWSAIGMKKGRPGTALSVLCRPTDEQTLLPILFRETTTLGVRRQTIERWTLPRQAQGLRKVAWIGTQEKKETVEFEQAKRWAEKRAIPLRKLLK